MSRTYSRGVLLGNWVEDGIECPRGGTFYFPPKETIDYEKMKPKSRKADAQQNKINGQQGTGFYTVVHHDSHINKDNFTTTTDLVYRHLPMPLCGPEMRYFKKAEHQWYPQPDFMIPVGNLTKFGLREFKQYEWACTDVSDYNGSLYDDSFIPPQLNQYLKVAERKARDSSFTKTFRFKMTKPLQKKPKEKK